MEGGTTSEDGEAYAGSMGPEGAQGLAANALRRRQVSCKSVFIRCSRWTRLLPHEATRDASTRYKEGRSKYKKKRTNRNRFRDLLVFGRQTMAKGRDREFNFPSFRDYFEEAHALAF